MFSSLLKCRRVFLPKHSQLCSYSVVSKEIYDISSDTATKPTDAMFDVMKQASKEDDVFGMDSTTNSLESHVAKMLGHESALFCASGSMTNQLGLRVSLKQPPHSVLADARSHINLYECGGLAYHSQAPLTAVMPRGAHLTVHDIERHVIKDDLCGAMTKVIAVENTLNGTIMDVNELQSISKYAKEHGYLLHMDGARLWEASAAKNIPLSAYGSLCDTVSVCVSKGVGAPIGSLLVSDNETIRKARHLRKLMGGGWRQSGGLAAVADYCLENVLPTMKDTQKRTQRLWEGLEELGMKALLPVETNMIFIDTRGIIPMKLWANHLLEYGNIKIDASDDRASRIVLHYQITDNVVDLMLDITRKLIHDAGTKPDDGPTPVDASHIYPSASPII
ncbi:hypothetical protein DM01DRAFT_1303053 [Hesseltinella vesiculosa]|uniref:Aromatic amino acid beta-eliminating lyase/threonine aldolase domain-containing protein n=1 Tax=Hesseltinella vesiculosa TaxID=101127 RepID=A0A1X2GLM2_9FUNG|nr:hypothetical protein DM01DRAFT_1303053 [Hesseltinella vesiculosa]